VTFIGYLLRTHFSSLGREIEQESAKKVERDRWNVAVAPNFRAESRQKLESWPKLTRLRKI
jgi:hypothetical protein